MQAKTTLLASRMLACVLNGESISELGVAALQNPTPLFLSLHTDDPGIKGDQTSKEIAYASYKRMAVKRDATNKQWMVADRSAVNMGLISFPKCTSGNTVKAKWVGIGTAESGTGNLLFKGEIGTPEDGLPISQNIRPEFEPRDITIIEN